MPPQAIHTLITHGRHNETVTLQQVAARLIRLFKGAKPDQIQRLLSGKRVVVKK